MDWMAAAAIASVAGTSLVAVGLTLTWRKNGHDEKVRDEDRKARAEAVVGKQALREHATEMAYKSIVRELHHEDHGLGALEKKVTVYGVEIARHDERITNLES